MSRRTINARSLKTDGPQAETLASILRHRPTMRPDKANRLAKRLHGQKAPPPEKEARRGA